MSNVNGVGTIPGMRPANRYEGVIRPTTASAVNNASPGKAPLEEVAYEARRVRNRATTSAHLSNTDSSARTLVPA